MGNPDKQQQIFETTFAMLAKLASADGAVRRIEADAVDSFIKNVLKLDPEQRKAAIETFNVARKSDHGFRYYAEHYRSLVGDKPELYDWLIDVFVRVCLVDRELSKSELELLAVAKEVFAVSQERFEKIISRYRKKTDCNVEAAYHALGVSASATLDEVTNKFQELLGKYDPERIVALGLPEEFVVLAKERREAILEAFDKVREASKSES